MLGVAACGSGPAPAPQGPLTVVGADSVTAGMVLSVSQARGILPIRAAERVSEDARFARALVDQEPELAAYLERIALARALSLRTIRQSRGEVNDEELERFTARHWAQLDRPATSRTTHVVVRVPDGGDRSGARRVAARLRDALGAARTRERFTEIVAQFPETGFELKVEDLQPVTPDGRVYDPARPVQPATAPRYAEAFAAAANAIPEVGQVSDPVETSYGFHVILLTERLPEQRVEAEERRRRLRPEIESHRARERERATIEAERRQTAVEILPSALAHTEGLLVGL